MKNPMFPCAVCGFLTIETPGDWDICPICYWEDDVLYDGKDTWSSANKGMKISEAQANFVLYGTADLTCQHAVRPITDDDERDPNWQPLPEALELVEKAKKASKRHSPD